MATGGCGSSDADSSVTVNKLTCAICLHTYCRPKLLACFHSFCQSCLQGVAGLSPTFYCPLCRARILLPPGGVVALQTNFYIEEELDGSSSPQRRLCDVCTDDREATHACMQCQQKLCFLCRKFHDAIRSCRGHTVVSLSQDQEGLCGDESSDKRVDQQKMEMCPKHPDQRLLLHCNKCQAAICMQCKLIQHEGHPTDDLVDTWAKVKAKLQDMLGELTKEIEQTDHLLVAVGDQRTKLQQHQQTTEQDFRSRADTLFQWVNQALDEALTSVQSATKQMEKTLQDQAEQLRNKNSKLQAQRDHLMRALKDGKEADFVSLEAQLSSCSSSSDNIDVTRIEKELTKDIPTFHVKHNITAVNQLQLRDFVGVLEPVLQTSCPGETCDCRLSGSIATEGSASMGRIGKPSAADRSVGVRQKKAPREFNFSKDPESLVIVMCSLSHSRFWVLYREAGTYFLKLFDAEGRVLTTVENVGNRDGLSTICDDIALAWCKGRQTVKLIRPDGSMTSYDMGISIYHFTSTSTNDDHYLITDDNKLHHVKFTLKKNDRLDRQALPYGTTPAKPTGKPHFSSEVTHSRLDVVFDETPSSEFPRHVSAAGRYFAFIQRDKGKVKVEVYTKAGMHGSRLLSSYTPQDCYPTDVRFCQMGRQELLMVAVPDDDKVHVVDHTDDCRFVHYLDTGTLNFNTPWRLTTDCDHHLTIGCGGREVVMVDL